VIGKKSPTLKNTFLRDYPGLNPRRVLFSITFTNSLEKLAIISANQGLKKNTGVYSRIKKSHHAGHGDL